MKKFLLITCLFVSSFLIADDHETSEKSLSDRFASNPNHLLSFKECKETKEGVAGLLALTMFLMPLHAFNNQNILAKTK